MRIRKKENSIGLLGKILNNKSSGNTNDTYSCNYIDNGIDGKLNYKYIGSTMVDANDLQVLGSGFFTGLLTTNVPVAGWYQIEQISEVENEAHCQQKIYEMSSRRYNYVRNKVNGVWQQWQTITNDYSTEEQIIGTWTDGKPIYRKVILAQTPTDNNDTVVLNLASLNIESLVNIDTKIITSDILDGNYYYTSTNNSCVYIASGWTIHMKLTGSLYFNKNLRVIVEYTKTTD